MLGLNEENINLQAKIDERKLIQSDLESQLLSYKSKHDDLTTALKSQKSKGHPSKLNPDSENDLSFLQEKLKALTLESKAKEYEISILKKERQTADQRFEELIRLQKEHAECKLLKS